MNKLTITLSVAVLSLGLAIQAGAETPNLSAAPAPTPDSGTGIATYDANQLATIISTGTIVLAKNFTINTGGYEDFRVPTNFWFDSSSQVAISLLATNYNLAGTFIVPFFAAPGADYTAVNLIDCSKFTFANQGGAVESVYGSHMVVRVYNLTNRAITYNQLMVHWAGR